jgi:hypothetical protein
MEKGAWMPFCHHLWQGSCRVGFVDIIIQWPVRPDCADERYPARIENGSQSLAMTDITSLGPLGQNQALFGRTSPVERIAKI